MEVGERRGCRLEWKEKRRVSVKRKMGSPIEMTFGQIDYSIECGEAV